MDTEIDACPTQSGHILNNLSQTEVGNDTENEDNDNTNVCMPCELVTDKNASRTIWKFFCKIGRTKSKHRWRDDSTEL